MNGVESIKRLFRMAILFLFLMSASVLIMPMSEKMSDFDSSMPVFSGIFFWLSCVTGYTLIFFANKERKNFIRRNLDGDITMGCRPGIITFFDNVPAIIADASAAVSLMLMICIGYTQKKYDFVMYILLFVLLFSLNMHCLFNGRIYKITKYKSAKERV